MEQVILLLNKHWVIVFLFHMGLFALLMMSAEYFFVSSSLRLKRVGYSLIALFLASTYVIGYGIAGAGFEQVKWLTLENDENPSSRSYIDFSRQHPDSQHIDLANKKALLMLESEANTKGGTLYGEILSALVSRGEIPPIFTIVVDWETLVAYEDYYPQRGEQPNPFQEIDKRFSVMIENEFASASPSIDHRRIGAQRPREAVTFVLEYSYKKDNDFTAFSIYCSPNCPAVDIERDIQHKDLITAKMMIYIPNENRPFFVSDEFQSAGQRNFIPDRQRAISDVLEHFSNVLHDDLNLENLR